MKNSRNFRSALDLAVLLSASLSTAQSTANTIASRTGTVDGVKLHYLTAGRGPAVILLHGYTQTSRMWRPLIPQLAENFTVIAPDLPGMGDSDIPADGLDMKNAAIRIHALAKSLGIGKARVVAAKGLERAWSRKPRPAGVSSMPRARRVKSRAPAHECLCGLLHRLFKVAPATMVAMNQIVGFPRTASSSSIVGE
jgi:hypothetical protein